MYLFPMIFIYIHLFQIIEYKDWHDERLVWNPAQYSNIRTIVVRASRIWTPELAIINGYGWWNYVC